MRILSRLPEGRGTGPLLGTPLARSRRQQVQPEIMRTPSPDDAVEVPKTPDPLGPARGICLAVGAGSIGWALLLYAIL